MIEYQVLGGEARGATRAKRLRRVQNDRLRQRPESRWKQAPTSKWDIELQAQIDAGPPGEGQRHCEMMSLGFRMVWSNHPKALDEESLVEFFVERYSDW